MKAINQSRKILTLVLFISLLVTVTTPLYAQTPYRGTVVRLPGKTDPYFDIVVDPGEKYEDKFVVQHEYQDESKQVQLYVYLTDFEYDEITGETIYPETGNRTNSDQSIVDWVKFDKTDFILRRYGEEVTVNFEINVPSDAVPGTRYGNIIVSNSPPTVDLENSGSSSQGAALVGRLVVATVLVSVKGGLERHADIVEVKVTDRFDNTDLFGIINLHPIKIATKISNTGTQSLLPGGDIIIHQGDSKQSIITMPLNAQRLRVLPKSAGTFSTTWEDSSLLTGHDGSLSLNLSKFPQLNWGRYFAEVALVYRNTADQLELHKTTVEFWILPWRVLIVLLVAIIIYFGYRFYKRKQRKQALAKHSNNPRLRVSSRNLT